MLEVRSLAQATSVLRQAQEIRGGQAQSRDRAQHGGQELSPDSGHERGRRGAGLAACQDADHYRARSMPMPLGRAEWYGDMGTRAQEAADEIRQLFREILPSSGPHPAKTRGEGEGGILEPVE